ncbi:MAG: hypothetical protein ACLFUQ_03290, partial [Candidatus Izemoplasmataceae bacterium]
HPEPYGESIVELVNGMHTDVFTNEAGELVTMTNDAGLIRYLKDHPSDDPAFTMEKGALRIRSMHFQDASLLKKWMNSNDNWLLQGQDYSDEEIRIHISHAITYGSHAFIVEIDDKPIATIIYDLHEEDLLFDLRVYEKNSLDDEDAKTTFKLIKDHVDGRLTYRRMLAHVLKKDRYHRLLYGKLGFKSVDAMAFDTPVSSKNDEKTLVFEYTVEGRS